MIRTLMLSSLLLSFSLHAYRVPRVTVIFVIDQFAYHYIPKVKGYLPDGGIKHLLKHGVVYENAYFPHGVPSTAPGHAGLNTGAYPKDHGIIGNKWYKGNGTIAAFEDCDDECAALLSEDGSSCGVSPRHLMIDGITDQFIFSRKLDIPRYAFSISLKKRSAVATAGRMGKAIWFNEKTGKFTSSKAYFESLPDWVEEFNNCSGISDLTSVRWDLFYPKWPRAYNFPFAHSYSLSAFKETMIDKDIPIDHSSKEPFDLFECTPAANKVVLDLAEECIRTHIKPRCDEQMILWVCLGSLDKVGHKYGPQSQEVIDTIYHLDCQIQQFMKSVTKYLKRMDFLFVLTSDHGVSPIPERLKKEGYHAAGRLMYQKIVPAMNNLIKKEFGIDNVVFGIQTMQVYLDTQKINALPTETRTKILQRLKKYLLSQKGVKRVWTAKELQDTWFLPDQLESYYKSQYYPGRSGQLIIQPEPYTMITKYPFGTGHRTPYEADTHVPFIIYQKGHLERRHIYKKVWTLQLANTLAHLLNIPKPSSSTFGILPGIIDYDPITGEVIQPVAI